MESLRIIGGETLLPDIGLARADVSLDDGHIAEIDGGGEGKSLDARPVTVCSPAGMLGLSVASGFAGLLHLRSTTPFFPALLRRSGGYLLASPVEA